MVKFHHIHVLSHPISTQDMDLLAKFGDPSFSHLKVIVRTSSFLQIWIFCLQMTLKVKAKFLHIKSHPRLAYPRCTYGPNLVTLASILQKLLQGQPCFLQIWTIFNICITLKVKVKYLHMKSHPRTMHDAPI